MPNRAVRVLLEGRAKASAPALLLICLAAMRPLGLLIRTLLPGVDTQPLQYDAGVVLQGLVMWLLPAVLLLPWRMKRLGPKRRVRVLTACAFPLGMALQLGMGALMLLYAPHESSATVPLPTDAAGMLCAVLAMVIAPALCEEAFFRGGVVTFLCGVASPAAACVLGTALFALMHASLPALPSHLMISALCTLLMLATGRLLPCVLAHMGYNAMALIAAWVPASRLYALLLVLPLGAAVWMIRSLAWHKGSEKHMKPLTAVMLAAVLVWETVRYIL